MAIRARYTAKNGDFIPGVPARHLDEEEYDALPADLRKRVREDGVYDVKSEAEMAPHAQAEAKAAEAKPAPAKADAPKGGA